MVWQLRCWWSNHNKVIPFVTSCLNFQVMLKVRQAKATPPTPPRRRHIRRTSSRRSGYAFSHAQGYGDLVTSRRFLRRPAVTRASGFVHVGRTSTGFSPMGRSAGYSPTGRLQDAKTPDVEATSLQMYRSFTDQALWHSGGVWKRDGRRNWQEEGALAML